MEELPQSETGLSAAALDRISLSLSEAELDEIAFDGEAAERVPAFYFQNLWTVTGGEPPDPSEQGSRRRSCRSSCRGSSSLSSPSGERRGVEPELQAALESLEKVVVAADSTDGGGDRCCPICLDELEVGGEARMMGCSTGTMRTASSSGSSGRAPAPSADIAPRRLDSHERGD
ncbi:unnamed protein product [Spirodela intermedia]|uniref:Uncharacterized protein n=1 Tax=Spirodela intermedia TaxID=51605 RepID=A0A7I8J8H9_SPIIN|nr:unnamed protein product [Spirodela intermedia]CAA6666055.1 unnamed protein product [Spirodela intermedia]